MALSDSTFKSVLKGIFDDMSSASDESPKDNDWLADRLSKAIDDQIKTLDVQIGIDVAGGTVSGGALVACKTSSLGKVV
jgi:hypothetical protein